MQITKDNGNQVIFPPIIHLLVFTKLTKRESMVKSRWQAYEAQAWAFWLTIRMPSPVAGQGIDVEIAMTNLWSIGMYILIVHHNALTCGWSPAITETGHKRKGKQKKLVNFKKITKIIHVGDFRLLYWKIIKKLKIKFAKLISLGLS